jgi:hypothetical protein
MALHLGIKIGPDCWLDKLDNDLGIRRAEVYFDLNRMHAYRPMFAWLRAHQVQAGLHVSTRLEGGVVPNLATADRTVRCASAALIRHILDVAAEQGMRFVVFHPGSYRIQQIVGGRNRLIGDETDPQEGNRLLIEEALSLAAYGQERGVMLLAENMPACDFSSFAPANRAQIVAPGFVPHTVLRALGERACPACPEPASEATPGAERGDGRGEQSEGACPEQSERVPREGAFGLCVDVGHLYAEVARGEASADARLARTMDATRTLLPYARHLHLSTVVPPWNGSDSHNGFLDADYVQGAEPSRAQIVDWLRLAETRFAAAGRDVWAIPEPEGGAAVHLANYRLLRTLMEQVT